jgi:hypothetical protein
MIITVLNLAKDWARLTDHTGIRPSPWSRCHVDRGGLIVRYGTRCQTAEMVRRV